MQGTKFDLPEMNQRKFENSKVRKFDKELTKLKKKSEFSELDDELIQDLQNFQNLQNLGGAHNIDFSKMLKEQKDLVVLSRCVSARPFSLPTKILKLKNSTGKLVSGKSLSRRKYAKILVCHLKVLHLHFGEARRGTISSSTMLKHMAKWSLQFTGMHRTATVSIQFM